MSKWRLLYHVVWATKGRQPIILPEMEAYLYEMIGVKGNELGGHVFAANGMTDHVHIVTSIPPRIAVAKYIGDIKGYTSRLVSLKFECPFKWQEGYGIFTVSVPNLRVAIQYVERQKEHHAAGTTIQALEQTLDTNEVQDSD